MVDQHIIDEAKARGIVPGATIQCASDGTNGTVAPYKEWIEKSSGSLQVGFDDRGTSLYAFSRQNNRWATVITPAPQAAAEGLVEGDSCECGPAMRAAIIELAKELGVGLRSEAPASAPLLWYGGRLCYTSGGPRCETIRTMLQPGQFYDRLSHHKKTIRIGDHEVKFNAGSIKVGCTTIDNATVRAIAANLKD